MLDLESSQRLVELAPLGDVFNHILVNTSLDADREPWDHDPRVHQDYIRSSLEIFDRCHFIFLWDEHVLKGNLAVLDDAKSQFIFYDFRRDSWPLILDNKALNLVSVCAPGPNDEEVFVTVADPSFIAVYDVPSLDLFGSGLQT